MLAVAPLQAHARAESPRADEVALPDAADLVSAYLSVRRWLDGFDLPSLDDPVSRIHISASSGICVQLRRSGRVLGVGTIAPTPHVEDDLMVRRAIGRAMSQVLGDTAVSRLPDERRDEVGRSLVLEMEVAGSPEPLIARTFQHVARQVEPGVHGVALRRGDRWAMVFPSQLLATNGAERIAAQLPLLAEELGLSAADMETLTREHNVSVYRFRTSHLVQNAPDQLPFETFRGDRLVMRSEITRDSITQAANALAGHILTRAWPDVALPDLPQHFQTDDVPILLGNYRPMADRYDPLLAPPFEQALTAFALVRYAAMPSASRQIAEDAATQAATILTALRKQFENIEAEIHHTPIHAASLHAIDELFALDDEVIQLENDGLDDGWREVIDAWADDLFRWLLADLRGVIHRRGGSPTLDGRDAHAVAMAVSAVSRRMLASQRDTGDDHRLSGVLDLLWEQVPPEQHVGLLPWIGWAERDLALLTGAEIPNRDRLVALRAALYESQVGAGNDGGLRLDSRDLDGGFVLADRRWPDSQSVRPMVWLAAMMREAQLTDSQSWQQHEERLLGMMRFLMQLTVRESARWSLRNPQRALGGLRSATWDSDQPLAAQAMALLAITEAVKTLDAASDAAE
jgi:hypothetical protein